jgi:hypothetical protein
MFQVHASASIYNIISSHCDVKNLTRYYDVYARVVIIYKIIFHAYSSVQASVRVHQWHNQGGGGLGPDIAISTYSKI